MTDGYEGLKEYMKETLGVEIARLTRVVERQENVLRDIETKTTTRTAELQKDVENLYDETDAIKRTIDDVRRAIEQEESTRQFISNENRNLISGIKDSQTVRWEAQGKINESIGVLVKIFWAIFTVVMGLVITQVYQIIFAR